MRFKDLPRRQQMAWLSESASGGGLAYPSVLDDGNTVAWYDYTENITQVTGVSVWGDKSGNGNDLLQATTTNQPALNADGILFDGADNSMKTVAFTLEQPEFIYIVLNRITWTINKYIFDGNTSASGRMTNATSTPNIGAYAGSSSSVNGNLPLNTYGIVRLLFNGASSKLQVNETSAVMGDFGSNDMGGFALCQAGGGGNYGHISVKEIIIRKTADGATDESAIYSYLASKYGI